MVVTAMSAALALALGGSQPATQSDDLNVARGLRATFSVPPNYEECVDGGDSDQLTDGAISSRILWHDKAAVGWKFSPRIEISFDLGQSTPVRAVELHAAASNIVPWPKLILAQGSDDGKDWHDLGELIGEDESAPKAYETQWFRATTGEVGVRYVKIVVLTTGGSQELFTDEVRILRSTESQSKSLASMRAPAAGGLLAYQVGRAVRLRVLKQVAAAKELARGSRSANDLLGELDGIASDARQAGPVSAQSLDRAGVLGTSDLDRRVAKVRAAAWRDLGLPPLVLWKTHRYAYTQPSDTPPSANPAASLRIDALQGESRGDALMVTNTTDADQDLAIQVNGLSGGSSKVAIVPWVDTNLGVLASSALPWSTGGTVPAGTTSRIWVRIDTSGMTPGVHRGKVVITTSGGERSIPIVVSVSRVRATAPQMSLTTWDYAVHGVPSNMTASQIDAVWALMREAHIDTAWARRSVLPWPAASAFDSANHLVKPLDFTLFDRWLSETPDIRNHLVFVNAPDTFAGARQGTEAFDERVAEWAKAIRSHVPQALAGRVGFQTVDEPLKPEQADRNEAWQKAIKAGAPDLVLLANPQIADPNDPAAAGTLRDADIVMLHVGRVVGNGQGRQAYRSAVRPGARTWIYYTNAGGKALSPNAFYRMAPWRAFAEDATGLTLWALTDNGSAVSSWDEYTATTPVYTPIYFDGGVTDSVHLQALAEGMEDAELFRRLRETTRGTNLQSDADRLLARVGGVATVPTAQFLWPNAPSPQAADDLRVQAIALLEKANP